MSKWCHGAVAGSYRKHHIEDRSQMLCIAAAAAEYAFDSTWDTSKAVTGALATKPHALPKRSRAAGASPPQRLQTGTGRLQTSPQTRQLQTDRMRGAGWVGGGGVGGGAQAPQAARSQALGPFWGVKINNAGHSHSTTAMGDGNTGSPEPATRSRAAPNTTPGGNHSAGYCSSWNCFMYIVYRLS
jgi:hypothetical protein